MAVDPAVAAAEREVLLDETRAQRHGDDGSRRPQAVVREPCEAPGERGEQRNRGELHRGVRGWVAAGAARADADGARRHAATPSTYARLRAGPRCASTSTIDRWLTNPADRRCG